MKNQHDFPYDVLENILSRLPVKSLLRLKTVCKSWNAMIKDPGFAGTHSKQSKLSNSQRFFVGYSCGEKTYSWMKFKGHEFYMESVGLFQSEEYKYAYYLCGCEGILLFEDIYRETRERKFVLLNPFTRNYSTFSCPFYDEILDNRICFCGWYGLCFDKYEDDYKFVAVLRGGRYLVYSVKNDSWIERQSELRGYVCFRGTYVNGVVYWIMSDCLSFFSPGEIVYFDPKDDLLKQLRGPEDLKNVNFELTNLRGNLCLYTIHEKSVIRIFLLKEHEHEHGGRKRWMKLMTADYNLEPPEDDLSKLFLPCRPLYLTSENEVVFQNPWSMTYAVYRPEKQKFGEIKKLPFDTVMIGSSCLESLHFPAIRREW
ncbi:F-box/kelch-repeat protein At3g23880-like [Primulina eburnea]|uniref:F-box/kelch-repeat protein At3g23880-like n=1 Tax=Primulina eburnea TaxID=1245227 RepID=UPI003C6C25CF